MADLQTNDIGEDGVCSVADCDEDAQIAAVCDTGQVKHYCCGCGGGKRAGTARVEKWRAL